MFRSSPPLKDTIFKSIQNLNLQRVKLEQVSIRLRKRDKLLFNTCAKAIKNENKYRAIVFANELVEVRKLFEFVMHAQIAIERIILRLETVKDLSDVLVNLKPALKTLRGVANLLVKVMPEVAYELGKVNDSISETLAATHVGTPRPITPFEHSTPQSEEILTEVGSFLEQRLEDKLPEPPASTVSTTEPRKKVRKMIALAATCSEAEINELDEPKTSLSYQDVALQSVSFSMIKHSSSLEDCVLDYVKRCDGNIDLVQCALELNVPYQDLKNAIEKLGAQGKIQIER